MGADGAELDVRLSADGVPVVFHDADLSRLFAKKAPLSDLTLRALRRLSFGPKFGAAFEAERIPTLDEAIETLLGLLVNIELKSDTLPDGRLEARVAECIRNAGAGESAVISSFNPLSIAAFRHILPDVATAFLFSPGGRRGLRGPMAGYALGTQFLSPASSLVDAARVARWHRDDFNVMTWTVNTEAEARRCVGCGVDAIITNYPDRLRAALRPGRQTKHEHSTAEGAETAEPTR